MRGRLEGQPPVAFGTAEMTRRFNCEAVRLTLDGFCGPVLAISAQRLSGARDPSGPSAACAGQAAPVLAALQFILMLLDRVLA